MSYEIDAILQRFQSTCEHWQGRIGRMEKKAQYAYVWHPPREDEGLSARAKAVALSFQAITHGNEVGGIEVLLALLELLGSGVVSCPLPLGFILGNPEAARADRRYLESDLNRSFGQKSQASMEQKRAHALEPLLEESLFFLDFHQTIEPTLSPFFIFPYAPSSYQFAAALHQQIPIVTHWGRPFSHDGMCSDEYVNYRGGIGITLELGQKRFDAYHAGVGLQVALSAVQYVLGFVKGNAKTSLERAEGALYTWKSVVAYEAGMTLREGLVNFQVLKVGDHLGFTADRKDIRAKADGWLLFPKYPRDPAAPPAKEIYRIIKRILPEDLGRQGVLET